MLPGGFRCGPRMGRLPVALRFLRVSVECIFYGFHTDASSENVMLNMSSKQLRAPTQLEIILQNVSVTQLAHVTYQSTKKKIVTLYHQWTSYGSSTCGSTKSAASASAARLKSAPKSSASLRGISLSPALQVGGLEARHRDAARFFFGFYFQTSGTTSCPWPDSSPVKFRKQTVTRQNPCCYAFFSCRATHDILSVYSRKLTVAVVELAATDEA